MKNSQLVTAWLDQAMQTQQIGSELRERPLSIALEDQWLASMGEGQELFDACLHDGWTVPELDAIYERRFGFKVSR